MPTTSSSVKLWPSLIENNVMDVHAYVNDQGSLLVGSMEQDVQYINFMTSTLTGSPLLNYITKYFVHLQSCLITLPEMVFYLIALVIHQA
jgi:hypothetical protein